MDSDSDLKTRVTAIAPRRSETAEQSCLVVIHAASHSDLGRRCVLDKDLVTIGRGRDNDIVLAGDSVSRRHARLERRGEDFHVIDLASTNGTYINDDGRPVRERPLEPGDQLRIGETVLKLLAGSDVELQYHEIVFKMAATDGLTQLLNRKQLDISLQEEILRAERHGRPLSVLMLDLDHFKRINDDHGHLAGDAVLRIFASLLKQRLRPSDVLARYGGEEFCAVLPETSVEQAARMADSLRRMVESHIFHADGKDVRVTMSVGVGGLGAGMAMNDLYRCADDMLYRAKRTGRNRVCA